MLYAIAVTFIILHTIDDREVAINPHEIVSITKPGGQMTQDANCMIGTTDGKFFTVIEQCGEIIEEIARNRF